jgi:hypothetical protein
MVQEPTEPTVVQSSETVNLTGPNRDRGRLLSFALKGDIAYRVLTNTDSGDQALVITGPEDVIRKMATDTLKAVDALDQERLQRSGKVRVKE